jgi:hypothetical protein
MNILSVFSSSAFFKNALLLLGFFMLSMNLAVPTYAEEFNLDQYNNYIDYAEGRKGISESKLLSDVESGTKELLAAVVDIGFDILSLLFILGVISFAAGLTMKNGQWSKWSSGVMVGTFIAIVTLRIAPIIVLTIDKIGFTLVINHFIQLLSSVGYYIAIVMFLIGLFLRSLNKIFEHPKYFRWGRSLLSGCVIIVVLSYFSPIIIANL